MLVSCCKSCAASEQTSNMLADGNVAGQEGQRVGVSRRLDARLRHIAHELVRRPHTVVAAILGDYESLGQIALVGRGEDADKLAHVLIPL